MPPTDAIALLKHDHRAVDVLFKKFEATGSRALKTRETLVKRITTELLTHATIEEQVFYPFVRSLGDKLNDDVLEALEEHHIVKSTLAELQHMAPSHERYAPKVTVLIESVRHHVKEEEHELFPAVRKASTPQALTELVPLLEAARAEAPTLAQPAAPDTPATKDVGTMASKSLETVKSQLAGFRDVVGDAAGKVGDAAGKVGDAAGKVGDAAGKAGGAAGKAIRRVRQ